MLAFPFHIENVCVVCILDYQVLKFHNFKTIKCESCDDSSRNHSGKYNIKHPLHIHSNALSLHWMSNSFVSIVQKQIFSFTQVRFEVTFYPIISTTPQLSWDDSTPEFCVKKKSHILSITDPVCKIVYFTSLLNETGLLSLSITKIMFLISFIKKMKNWNEMELMFKYVRKIQCMCGVYFA